MKIKRIRIIIIIIMKLMKNSCEKNTNTLKMVFFEREINLEHE